jgi:hypothetical protein
MPVRGSDADFGLIIKVIREYHPEVPVFVFGTNLRCTSGIVKLMIGGHTHVRDCVKFDDRSIGSAYIAGLERDKLMNRVVPGRYMETIAFTSYVSPLAFGMY